MRRRPLVPAALLAALAALAAPPPAAPQSVPSARGPRVRVLPSGVRATVLPMPPGTTSPGEAPVAAVVILGGGRAADRPGLEGTAELAAAVLQRRLDARWPATARREVEGGVVGPRPPGAVATSDGLAVALRTDPASLGDDLARLAAILGDREPTLELHALREAAVAALRSRLASEELVADRALLRAVYGGDHPYGRFETVASLRAVTPGDVDGLLAASTAPGNTVVAVAGPVEPDAVFDALEDTFGRWPAGAAPEPRFPRPEVPGRLRVLLVHRPGAAEVAVRVGRLLPGPTWPRWPTLSLAAGAVGGAEAGRPLPLPGRPGVAAVVRSTAARRRHLGFLGLRMRLPVALLAPAVDALLADLSALTDRPVQPDAYERAVGVRRRELAAELADPLSAAARTASLQLLGVPPREIQEEPRTVGSAGVQEIRQVAEAFLDPSEAVLIAVGDARTLRPALAAYPGVQVVSPDGRPLGLADLAPPGRPDALSRPELGAGTWTYALALGEGSPSGRLVRRLSPDARAGDGAWLLRDSTTVVGVSVIQALRFRPSGMDFLSLRSTSREGSVMTGLELRAEDGRLSGAVLGPAGREPLEMDVPPDVLVSDMVEIALWSAPLAEGAGWLVPVARPEAATVEAVPVEVLGREVVEVPAGRIPAWRVEVGGTQPRTLWLREEAPHVALRMQAAGSPLVLELEEAAPAPGGGP